MGIGQTWAGAKYEKKIRYLDYFENGTRMKGAGFIKMERWDGLCGFNIQITGLYRKDHFTRPFLLLTEGEERELCRLQFADGGVKTDLEDLDARDLDGQGLAYESIVGLRIPVSEGKEIVCIWGEMQKFPSPEPAKEIPEAPQEIEVTEEAEEKANIPGKEEEQEAEERQGAEERLEAEERQDTEESLDAEEPRESGKNTDAAERQGDSAPLMREDKWEQLSTIYPHIYPFNDDREYLSMGPGDFLIFPGKYYKLVSNSFLLHGFYNYDHLILARVEQRGVARYYIGVPGNYFEREKKVAVLFGFVSFESDREPAQEGDFGYYMIPVEL